MTDSHAETAARGIYLYCLARRGCLPAVMGLPEQELRGVDERYPVRAAEQAGVVAVIGDVDSAEFCDENLQKLPWVASRAFRHEAVVERIMGASPVLPVKFGTIFRSADSLDSFLLRHRDCIVRALEELRGKAEWSVKGYVIEEEARRMVAASDPAIQSRLNALSPTPGARYLQQRQLDAAIDAALRLWVAGLTDELSASLVRYAMASTQLRCHASAVTGRAERMVFNRSFLVASAALAHFRAAFSDVQHAHQGTGLILELRGPWPPYNFCPALSEDEP